jgi:hypothetical protein
MNDTQSNNETSSGMSALDDGLDGSARIEYRYLNMDTGRFHETQEAMVKFLGKGSLLRAIPNYQHNQCLIAGGRKEFSEAAAVLKCKRLTGILTFKEKEHEQQIHRDLHRLLDEWEPSHDAA